MDKTAPIRSFEYRDPGQVAYDRVLRRQLHLSLIVVGILVAATIGTALSINPFSRVLEGGTQANVSVGAVTRPAG
jgi:hypothetical protein